MEWVIRDDKSNIKLTDKPIRILALVTKIEKTNEMGR